MSMTKSQYDMHVHQCHQVFYWDTFDIAAEPRTILLLVTLHKMSRQHQEDTSLHWHICLVVMMLLAGD